MPFCPKCRYEYVDGIEECPDCALKLVKKLHEQPEDAYQDIKTVDVARFSQPVDAELAKLHLESVGIESIIIGGLTRASRVYPVGGSIQLQVREEDAERATHILAEAGLR
jgi:hypothetical protein